MRSTLFAVLMVLLVVTANTSLAQNNVGIGTTTPNASSILEVQSTTQGVLVPRMTTVQRLGIAAPANGLLVFDTNVGCFFYYSTLSAGWQNLCSSGSGTNG